MDAVSIVELFEKHLPKHKEQPALRPFFQSIVDGALASVP
jgi:hypothetical protein